MVFSGLKAFLGHYGSALPIQKGMKKSRGRLARQARRLKQPLLCSVRYGVNFSRFCIFLIAFLVMVGCSTDQLDDAGTLEALADDSELVLGNVIACAASDEKNELVNVFLYPREGASNIRYFETERVDVNENDFENYTEITPPLLDVFNGFMKRFEVVVSNERWVVVTFEEAGKTHVSNPIRLKQNTKPTEYLPDNISIESGSAMPIFSWVDGAYDGTAIYFQVVSDAQNNLLSGTYTFDRSFQYYVLNNVVLNVTKGTPPTLQNNVSYRFSLLAVSADNWVNQFSEITFSLD